MVGSGRVGSGRVGSGQVGTGRDRSGHAYYTWRRIVVEHLQAGLERRRQVELAELVAVAEKLCEFWCVRQVELAERVRFAPKLCEFWCVRQVDL